MDFDSKGLITFMEVLHSCICSERLLKQAPRGRERSYSQEEKGRASKEGTEAFEDPENGLAQ